MIILLGGTGFVGSAFTKYFEQNHIAFHNATRAEVDYRRPEQLTRLIESVRPDFLINCAGYSGKPNVDACEDHKAECLDGNSVLPGVIAEVCNSLSLPWGHVSSGCIYTGSHSDGGGFTETDPPNFSFRQNNCSFYSGSKALGEEVLAKESNVYIWRLRIPFDQFDNPRNYLSKLMRYERLLDARNSITHLGEFVAASYQCWQKKIPFGIYNMVNPGTITTREVVDLIADSGVCSKQFLFFSSEDEFMQLAAKTPRSNCVLCSQKIERAGIVFRPVQEAIRDALSNWTRP